MSSLSANCTSNVYSFAILYTCVFHKLSQPVSSSYEKPLSAPALAINDSNALAISPSGDTFVISAFSALLTNTLSGAIANTFSNVVLYGVVASSPLIPTA